MAVKLKVTEERMFRIIKWAIDSGMVTRESEFLALIGFARNAITNVRRGEQRFTLDQITRACTITGASADYVFGFTPVMFRKPPVKVIDLLKTVVIALESDQKKT